MAGGETREEEREVEDEVNEIGLGLGLGVFYEFIFYKNYTLVLPYLSCLLQGPNRGACGVIL